jgi:hypothetical protein
MSCPQFVVQCFAVRTAAHLLHLSSKSYAQHVALGDFYDSLTSLTDKYAEVYMGLEDQVMNWPAPATVERKNPVILLEDFLELVQDEMVEDKTCQSLTNILAEMEELTAQTLYKLRNLK